MHREYFLVVRTTQRLLTQNLDSTVHALHHGLRIPFTDMANTDVGAAADTTHHRTLQ